MISKALLRKRLGVALGQTVKPCDFTWFFARFCEVAHRPDVRTAKMLSYKDVTAFSDYAGYDLHYPIPLPLLRQI